MKMFRARPPTVEEPLYDPLFMRDDGTIDWTKVRIICLARPHNVSFISGILLFQARIRVTIGDHVQVNGFDNRSRNSYKQAYKHWWLRRDRSVRNADPRVPIPERYQFTWENIKKHYRTGETEIGKNRIAVTNLTQYAIFVESDLRQFQTDTAAWNDATRRYQALTDGSVFSVCLFLAVDTLNINIYIFFHRVSSTSNVGTVCHYNSPFRRRDILRGIRVGATD